MFLIAKPLYNVIIYIIFYFNVRFRRIGSFNYPIMPIPTCSFNALN